MSGARLNSALASDNPVPLVAKRPTSRLSPGLARRSTAIRARALSRRSRWGVPSCYIMTREAEELIEAAPALPLVDRAALVVRLLDSISAPNDDVAAAHRSESRGPLEAAYDGGIGFVDDDDAMRMIGG